MTAMQPMEQASRQQGPSGRRAHEASMRYLERLAASVPDCQFKPSADTRQIPAVERRPGVSFQFSPENSRANSPGRYVRARFSMAVLIEDMAGLSSVKCEFNFAPGSTAVCPRERNVNHLLSANFIADWQLPAQNARSE